MDTFGDYSSALTGAREKLGRGDESKVLMKEAGEDEMKGKVAARKSGG